MSRTDTLSVSQPAALPEPRLNIPSLGGFLRRLARTVEHGHLLFRLPNGETIQWSGQGTGPSASLTVHRWRAIRRLVFGGDIGFAEAYIDGDWSTPDLTALIELVARNHQTMVPAMDGSWLSRTLNRLRHIRRGNTKRGS